MKISLKWLNEYIDLKDFSGNVGALSHKLTQAGLEVENIEDPSKHWDKVVVGHIVKFDKHPDADRLTLCQVDLGEGEPSQIICGATNHKLGDYVVVATPGAVLPGDFKIKKSKIRGVASNGMLCSEKELGLGEAGDGIIILPGEPKPGSDFRKVFDGADTIFDLNVTPNRADCLSHLGLARELSTLLDRPVKLPESELQEAATSVESAITVQLKAEDQCPRYCGRVIKGIQVKASPDWLTARLKAVGLKSINNIVDVTNYVMFEYGQPLHAFDLAELKGQKIVIEKASKGEAFTSLDGTELKLSDTDLLIKDGERAVALAGVVGGKNSGVSEKTTDIFLESAFFSAEGVRKTSRSHGVETDSCYRFSRGVDPSQTLNAMNRAAWLIQQVAGGEIQKGHVDLYPKPVQFAAIETTSSYIAQRMGYPVSDSDFENWMQRLGCEVEKKGKGFSVTPPPYRWDMTRPEDLVEEYGRLQGYDTIVEKLPKLVDEPTGHGSVYINEMRVKSLLAGLGCYEAVNYAFIPKGASAKIWGDASKMAEQGLTSSPESVPLANPLSEELGVMRESLLPGLFKNLVHNDHHGVHFGRLFEIGQGHFLKDGPQEESRLSLTFWGEPSGLWQTKDPNLCLFSLKSTIESLLTKLGAKSWQWRKPKDVPPGFHPGQSAQLIYEGKSIGIMGSVHPQFLSDEKIRSKAAWAELSFERLMSRQPRISKFKAVPKFPTVERDIALLVPDSVAAEDVGVQIKKSAGPLLENYRVFDIYQDKDLKAAGRRSIAFRLRFQSEKETLSDAVINGLRDQVVSHLCKKLPVESR